MGGGYGYATVLVWGALVCGALCGGARAQAPALPQARPPAGALAPTRDEIQPQQTAPAPVRPSRLSVDGGLERTPCALADPAYADIRLTMTGAEFAGLKQVDPADLRPAYEAYVGKPQPIGVLCDIRDAAARILREKGYLAAVQVPVQTIAGVPRFEVLFARVTEIRVRGDVGRAEALFAGYLRRLTREEVFNRAVAERYLLLARDLPGYDVRLSLRRAGTKPGELFGEVTVTRTPVEVDFNVQNLAGRDSGRFGGQLRGSFNGLTGLGDRTTVSVYTTADFDEQQIVQFAHEMRLGGDGLTLSGRFTYAWTDPDIGTGGGAKVDVKARTAFATLEAGYPFVRSQARNLRGVAGLDYLNQRVRLAGLPLSDDRLRVAYLRLEGDAVDTGAAGPIGMAVVPRWQVGGAIELRRGVDIFDATDPCGAAACAGRTPPSRLEGDPTATVLRASATAELRLAPGVSLAAAARGQYSAHPLYAFEEFSAGNYTIGRGYDPGSLLGDSGVGISAELRAGRLTPFANAAIAFQPFVFVDTAWAWNEDAGTPGDPRRLTSVGGGLRASLADRARFDLTVAVPTKRAPFATDRGDVRILMSLTTRLVPWSIR